jgi:hypothetical protein
MKEEEMALNKAIESGDADLGIHFVLRPFSFIR